MARSLLFAAAFYLNTAAFVLLGSPLLLGPRKYAMMGLRAHARASLWLLRTIAGTTFEVRGLENLPPAPALVAAKHQSAWDTFALIPLLRDPAMVMKAELGLIPFYGWFSRKFEHVFVDRGRGPMALRKLLRDARARAAQGRDIVIFPEGTRREPGAPPDYKPGVLALYDGLGLPCAPVALNSGVFWPRRSLRRLPGKIVVEVLPAIPPRLERDVFRKRLIEAIENASARLLRETAGESAAAPEAAVGENR